MYVLFHLSHPTKQRNQLAPLEKVVLLAHFFEHASQKTRFYKGFRMLILGRSDGYTFMSVNFSLLSSKKAQINGISTDIDKIVSGYERRVNALQTAIEQIPTIIQRALSSGIDASYILMDSWFTMPPLINGIDVIGLVKATKHL